MDIANSSVVKTIYKCLGNANRSEVDKEMCTVGTKVLINLAKYEKSSASVWQVIQQTHFTEILINYISDQDECPWKSASRQDFVVILILPRSVSHITPQLLLSHSFQFTLSFDVQFEQLKLSLNE